MKPPSNEERPRLSGTNLERAADHNQRITLHAIRVWGQMTRVELARLTGLTAPAIANITKRLTQAGLIAEAGQRRGGRGQPATKLEICPDACYSIGVNIDRDHITIVLVDFAGTTVARVAEDVDYASPAHVRALYLRSVPKMLAKAKVDISKLVGLGVAMPDDLGSIDLPGRPDSYGEWERIGIEELFSGPYNLPVFRENDAAAAAMGEMQFGFGQKVSSFFYILLSAGLGGGLVVDGNYVRGASGRSGEIGFMPALRADGVSEQLQKLVSLSALAEELANAGFTLKEAFGSGPRAKAAAPFVERWIDRAAQRFTAPLAAVNCLFNPAVVLLGGRLPTHLLELLAERVNARLDEVATDLPTIAPVSRAALAEDAPVVGAAILPFSHFLLPRSAALWKASQPGSIEAFAGHPGFPPGDRNG